MLSNITLKKFMIFNSSEGHHESEEQNKLLFHWTKESPDYKVDLAQQIDDICLCDASVNVSIRLKCDINQLLSNNCDPSQIVSDTNAQNDHLSANNGLKPNENDGKSLVLLFEKTMISIIEIEPEQSIWMAVHVGPPNPIEIPDSSSNQPQFDPGSIPTDAIERLVSSIYARFCLINGNFQMIINEVSQTLSSNQVIISDKDKRAAIRSRLRDICENYFNDVLPDIHLSSIISNLSSLYNYVLYLDLNPIHLMKVNSFINHMVCIDAINIRHTIVIFNDQLLWSSLNMYDTRFLYNYLVSVLIRDALQEELSKEVEKVRKIKEDMPIYITDVFTSIECSYSDETLPKTSVLANNDNNLMENFTSSNHRAKKLHKFYLTIFRSSNNMTLGLILTKPNLTDLTQRCEQILTTDSRLGVIPLVSLAQSVGQNFLRANSSNQNQATLTQSSSAISSTSNSMIGGQKMSHMDSGSGLVFKSSLSPDQKYIHINKLDVSISWPLNLDLQNNKELLLTKIEPKSNYRDIQPMNKKQRLIKYLIELEPEFRDMRRQTAGCMVEEFYGKTLNDSWLTVTNSKYKTIYSVHNMRNFGLIEAQQSAILLKSALAERNL